MKSGPRLGTSQGPCVLSTPSRSPCRHPAAVLGAGGPAVGAAGKRPAAGSSVPRAGALAVPPSPSRGRSCGPRRMWLAQRLSEAGKWVREVKVPCLSRPGEGLRGAGSGRDWDQRGAGTQRSAWKHPSECAAQVDDVTQKQGDRGHMLAQKSGTLTPTPQPACPGQTG